jgi:hypothetical protein
VSSIGTLFDHGFGLNLRKGNRLTMRIAMNHGPPDRGRTIPYY